MLAANSVNARIKKVKFSSMKDSAYVVNDPLGNTATKFKLSDKKRKKASSASPIGLRKFPMENSPPSTNDACNNNTFALKGCQWLWIR